MKSIILAQRKERDELLNKEYQPRERQKDTDAFLDTSLIKLITGPRRAGKSVFALLLLKGRNFAYLNFDDESLLEQFDENAVMQALQEVYPNYEYLLLDEIQNLEHWDLWVAKLYRRGCNIVITGSNARLLSSEMGTVLTGRFVEIEILPFSLNEFLQFRNIDRTGILPEDIAKIGLQVEDYMHYGGYPETIHARSITESYLRSLFDSIIFKDITKRFKIRKAAELYQLATYLISMFCNPFTYTSLAEDLNISSKSTVQKFCGYLEQTFLFFFLPRYDHKLKLMQKAPQKVYVVDNGFLSSSAFQTSENRGRLLENLVFLELLRRRNKVGENIFYYRNRSDYETDFVLRERHQVCQLIQVCFDMSAKKTEKREVNSLLACAKDFKCTNLLIITWSQDCVIECDDVTIHVVPFYKWCKTAVRII